MNPKITLEKEKKKSGNREEKERRGRKEIMAALLVFMLPFLEIAFEREKKLFAGRVLFCL